jgi:diacylglycerol kinase (ATP)
MMSGFTLVIWNPSASGCKKTEALRDELAATEGVRLVESNSPASAKSAIRDGLACGCRRVVAAGGDGTVNVVLEALSIADHSDVSLAVLPLGTGNDLARSIGMPFELDQAVEVALGGDVSQLDLVHLKCEEGQYVVANMCTSGNTGRYLEALTPEVKEKWGPYSYLRGVVNIIGKLETFEVRLKLDDELQDLSILNLFIANGRTSGGGLSVAPDSKLDDGLMDVVAILDGSSTDMMALARDYVLADFLKHPLVLHRQVRRISVEARQPMPVTIDGDIVTEGPFEAWVEPRRISIVRDASVSV